MATETQEERIDGDLDTFVQARDECYYEHCNNNCVDWATPRAAFAMNAAVYGTSTAIADLVRRELDTRGAGNGVGFVVYLVVIVSALYGLHMLGYFAGGWGGGMLAAPDQVECANLEFFVEGATTHCDEQPDKVQPPRMTARKNRFRRLVVNKSLPTTDPAPSPHSTFQDAM